MSYCSNCGGRLNDNGICPNCGGMSESNIRPTEQEDSDVLSCLNLFFTESPLKAVEKAARTRSATIWVTFGSLFTVIASAMSLAAFGTLSPGFFRELCGPLVESAIINSSANTIAAFGGLVLHAAVMAVLLVLILGIITKVVFAIHAEEKASLNQALNIAAFSLLPLSTAMLLAIPTALLSTGFAVMLLVTGICASAVSYYFGIQKASAFQRSPFLTLLVSCVIGSGIIALCSYGLLWLVFR